MASALIGHSAVRQWVMGDAAWERAATDDELARCITAVAGIAPAHAPLGPDGEVVAATVDQFEAALRATCW